MMVRIFALIAAFLTAFPAHAQQTKAQLNAAAVVAFPDQTVGAVTPAILRGYFGTVINSFQQFAGVNAQTGASYTVQLSDYGQLVTFTSAVMVAVTIPAASSAGFTTFSFTPSNLGGGGVTITPASGTINGAANLSLSTGQSAFVVSDGTNWQVARNSGGGVGVTPGGVNNAVQFNSGGAFGGIPVVNNGLLVTSGSGAPSLQSKSSLTIAGSMTGGTIPVFVSAADVEQATPGVVVAAGVSAGTGISITGTAPVSVALNGTLSGAGSVFATSTGALTNGNCVSISAGNFIDAGVTCNGGAGSGTVTAGNTNQVAFYPGNAATVAGLATGVSGVLVTSAASVPSISQTIPTPTQANITRTGTVTTGVWNGTAVGAAFGGTGVVSPTAHSILVAQGSSNFTVITPTLAGNLLIDQGAGVDWAGKTLSQDCTITSAGVITCLKTNNVAFGTFAVANAATPPSIGNVTPAAGKFTTLAATGTLTTNITGSTQCVSAATTGVLSGTGAPCGNPALAGGRLVAASANCTNAPTVQFTNISAAPVVCYVPYLQGSGNIITINGANFVFSTLTLTLSNSLQTAGKLYDVFVINNGGAATLCVDALPWTAISVSPARQDPLSHAANGLWVNQGIVNDCYNGAGSSTDFGPIAASAGTYLGTIYINTNGNTIWTPTPTPPLHGLPSGGAILGVFNAYNQVVTNAFTMDTTANYVFSGNSNWQNFGSNSTDWRISYVDGLGTLQGTSQATFFLKSDWSSAAAGVNGGGTSFCVDGVGTGNDATLSCPNGGPGTKVAPTSTSIETDAQVSNSGNSTGAQINIAKHWLLMLGFHFAHAMWVTQAGQTVDISCGNNGAICQMNMQVAM